MKKIETLILSFFLLFFIILVKVDAKINDLPLAGKIFYVDPGHGGRDPGALYKDIEEADINLQISKELVLKLEEKGAIVYLTRKGDYDLSSNISSNKKKSDLQNRVKLINNSYVDMYLSIHLNTYEFSNWKGAQVFYDDINEKNIILAKSIQESFKKILKSNRKIKQISNLYMFRHIKTPGVLLEVGFLTNPNERYLLQKTAYQKKISEAIITGVINYYNK